MKVLLTKDVRKVGQKGQVVEVAEGYGRNFLIKNGFAKLAVGGTLKDLKNKESSKKELEKKAQEAELKKLGEINKKEFLLKANASEKGHLFAGIHKKEIAQLVGVDEKNIILEKDIKEVGQFEIKISLGGKKGKIILNIEKK